MSQHVTQWIQAYLDGELHGQRLREIEAHLRGCADCQQEAASLRELSVLLQSVPRPAPHAAPERFAAQIGLRLPRTPEQSAWQRTTRRAWQAAPVGIIATWAFLQAALFTVGLLQSLGLAQVLAAPGPGYSAWTGTSGALGMLGSSLWELIRQGAPWLELGEPLLGLLGLELGITLLAAIGLWAWLASWWTLRRRELQTIEHQVIAP
ncbi:MAG: anti-sigma factor [Chloroflexota bacterium]